MVSWAKRRRKRRGPRRDTGFVLGTDFARTLRAAQAGEEDAFARLWRDANPAMIRYLRVVGHDDPYDEAMTRLNEAAVAFRRGDADTARAKLEAAEGIFTANGTEAATDDRFELDWLREQLTCAAS